MTLRSAEEGKTYIIRRIDTDDAEMKAFLFSLGCYSGEPITVVAHRRGGCVVSIKDARYNIDSQLAQAIIIRRPAPGTGSLHTGRERHENRIDRQSQQR